MVALQHHPFGVDVYTAGMLATGLSVPRLSGWALAITGDLLWFAVLLGTSLVAAGIADDDRFIALVMIVAMIVIPCLARRFVPALRPDSHWGRGPTSLVLESVPRILRRALLSGGQR